MRVFPLLALLLGLIAATATALLPAPSAAADTGPVMSVVKARTPWYAPRFLVRNRFEAAIPDYEVVPGLVRKYFTIADDGWLGGIYLWESRDAALAFYDDAWHQRIEDRYGVPAKLDVLSSPLQIEGKRTPPAAQHAEVGRDYVASWVRIPLPAGTGEGAVRAGFEAAAPTHAATQGLLRKYYAFDDESVGGVFLWESREAAEAFHGAAWRDRVRRRFGHGAEVEYFEAPVILDNERTAGG